MELRQIILAHQPDEAAFRVKPLQRADRVERVARLQLRFDIRRTDGGTARHRPRRRKTHGQRCHAPGGFERIARRHQPPRLVEPQCIDRGERDPAMAAVRGIERSAEQAGAGQGSVRQFSAAWRILMTSMPLSTIR